MATIKVVIGNNVSKKTVLVDSALTIKSVMESAGFDWTNGGYSMNGEVLMGSAAYDRTFDTFDPADTYFLLKVKKADNAARAKVCGDAVVIQSALKLDDIRMIEKYRPDALILKGGEDGKEPLFALASGGGGCTKYGIAFNRESRDDEKLATLTIFHSDMGDNAKEFVADKYGVALLHLNKLEESLPAVLDEINAEHEHIVEAIDVA